MRYRSLITSLCLSSLICGFVAISAMPNSEPVNIQYVISSDSQEIGLDLKMFEASFVEADQSDMRADHGLKTAMSLPVTMKNITTQNVVYLGNRKRLRLVSYLKYKSIVLPPGVHKYRT